MCVIVTEPISKCPVKFPIKDLLLLVAGEGMPGELNAQQITTNIEPL